MAKLQVKKGEQISWPIKTETADGVHVKPMPRPNPVRSRSNLSDQNTCVFYRSLKRSKGATLEHFEDFVRKQRADTNLGFEEDYEKLQPVGISQTRHAAELPENKQKNRYNNVLPYDVSRVKLSCVNPTDDYINANYVPGYNSQKEFIAAQGPLPHTVPDFWLMIWEKEIYAIIMLTKCVELGKIKCEHYWPKVIREAMIFGDLRVTLTAEFVLPDWTVRHLLVINNKTNEERPIRQFHFTAWPDHGVPVTTNVLIDFRHLVRDYMKEECPVNSPALVHCSAGVGRTGTFIAIDHIIYQMEREKTIDIYSIVHNLRMHRTLMVQTGAQYIFLHQCALDMIKAQKQAADSVEYENSDPTSIYENIPTRSTSRNMARSAYR
ncbi:receptor-type tyrosine-protein phosphatase eta-like [Lissotriton helveticus]